MKSLFILGFLQRLKIPLAVRKQCDVILVCVSQELLQPPGISSHAETNKTHRGNLKFLKQMQM